MLSQDATPLLTALQTCAARPHAAFYTPGHKRGQGAPSALVDVMGDRVFQADLPELPELDNLFAPQDAIAQAQALAAAAFGASQTYFLVNGSTCGIEAALLAICKPGDRIILPRNCHQSAIAGLILSGAVPIFVEPDSDPEWGIAHSITPSGVAEALTQHPTAKAVMMVYPTYYGACGDVEAIAQLAHQQGIPLIVDEAHGPHFAFHPDLPPSALSLGADLTVQSIHKVLSAFTQASMLHLRSELIDPERLSKALQLVQSTSPSYLLLASLDAARQQMAIAGKALMQQTLELADRARTDLSQIPGVAVLPADRTETTPGFLRGDRTRLTVDVTGLGLTGFAADEILHQKLGVTAELPSLKHLTFIISLGNTPADIDRLIQAFTTLASDFRGNMQDNHQEMPLYRSSTRHQPGSSPTRSLSPRDAFFAPAQTVALPDAIARISAELVCPYPPGIPVLFPGEPVTLEAVDYLQQVLAAGAIVTGCADPDLKTLKVVN